MAKRVIQVSITPGILNFLTIHGFIVVEVHYYYEIQDISLPGRGADCLVVIIVG
ncbi:MAG: hypothetical protein RJQ09_07790 [Cyclobacteriaceae bacterium]